MSIEDVTLHNGGPYSLYNQYWLLVENFPDVDTAIKNVVALWHEVEQPNAYTILHILGLSWETVCTICPIGSDKLMAVRNNGDTMTWECIHYVKVDGKIKYTSAINNSVEYKFKF